MFNTKALGGSLKVAPPLLIVLNFTYTKKRVDIKALVTIIRGHAFYIAIGIKDSLWQQMEEFRMKDKPWTMDKRW